MMKKLINESQWTCEYEESTHGLRFVESKFNLDRQTPDLAFVQKHWSEWSQSERFDFARAIAAKKALSHEDQAVIEELLKSDDDVIASTVVNAVPRLANGVQLVSLLISRLGFCNEPRANFYKALSQFPSEDVLSILMAEQDRLQKTAGVQTDEALAIDLISCSAALHKLTKSSSYIELIDSFAADATRPGSKFAHFVLERPF